MTDTGQVPGEGLPENAGGRLGQPHPADVHTPPADAGFIEQSQPQPQSPYAFLDPQDAAGEEDDLLLMPGAQGAWSEHQPQYQDPYQQPMTHLPGGYETGGFAYDQAQAQGYDPASAGIYDQGPGGYGGGPAETGYADYAEQAEHVEHVAHVEHAQFEDAQRPDPHPAQAAPAQPAPAQPAANQDAPAHPTAALPNPAQPNPAQATPSPKPLAHAAPTPPRRPLHMGPPVPDLSNGIVRSLADRGPADAPTPVAPVRQAEPPAAGPQYAEAPREDAEPLPGPQLADIPQPGRPWDAQGPQAATPVTEEPSPAEGHDAPGPYEQEQFADPAVADPQGMDPAVGIPAQVHPDAAAVQQGPAYAPGTDTAPGAAEAYAGPVP
ncbi:nicotinate-nucleotide-dimethylbenzimidazole phosphoribosyltransferase, partial [Streptomyces sparsogenes DSM 40356]